ncbi:MAG: hypothetical protein ACYC7A_17610 [Thermoanaerobaculia bacterium]
MNPRALAGAVSAFLLATSAFAVIEVQGVYDDAKVVRRVAEVSHRDLPKAVLRTLTSGMIDELRGKGLDGTYQYARYEKVEADRTSDRFTVRRQKEADALSSFEMKGEYVYALEISAPSRRMLVARNRKVYVDRVELTYVPLGGVETRGTFPISDWIEPGKQRTLNLPEISRSATAVVWARTENTDGTGSVDVSMLEASLVDDPASPFAAAVRDAKALMISIDKNDASATRRQAETLAAHLEAHLDRRAIAPPPITTAAPSVATTQESIASPGRQGMPAIEIYMELQSIEDQLTGTEAERREALDKLHQLIRRIRPASLVP